MICKVFVFWFDYMLQLDVAKLHDYYQIEYKNKHATEITEVYISAD